ncbi:hypothetical protein Mapa_001106 [Marchantia paleacea]|nr:hypothetical protein Mapa_001106 [Marchantia paleacea]
MKACKMAYNTRTSTEQLSLCKHRTCPLTKLSDQMTHLIIQPCHRHPFAGCAKLL